MHACIGARGARDPVDLKTSGPQIAPVSALKLTIPQAWSPHSPCFGPSFPNQGPDGISPQSLSWKLIAFLLFLHQRKGQLLSPGHSRWEFSIHPQGKGGVGAPLLQRLVAGVGSEVPAKEGSELRWEVPPAVSPWAGKCLVS